MGEVMVAFYALVPVFQARSSDPSGFFITATEPWTLVIAKLCPKTVLAFLYATVC